MQTDAAQRTEESPQKVVGWMLVAPRRRGAAARARTRSRRAVAARVDGLGTVPRAVPRGLSSIKICARRHALRRRAAMSGRPRPPRPWGNAAAAGL